MGLNAQFDNAKCYCNFPLVYNDFILKVCKESARGLHGLQVRGCAAGYGGYARCSQCNDVTGTLSVKSLPTGAFG